MSRFARYSGQALTWALLAVVVAAFGYGPAFSPIPGGHGELKLSVAHLSERLEPCRQLTEEERMALPPTRRVTEVCERGRAPTRVKLTANGETLIERSIRPAGWHGDGRSYLLEFFTLPAGHYRLELALTDTPGETGFDMLESFELEIDTGDSALLEVGDGDIRLFQPQGH